MSLLAPFLVKDIASCDVAKIKKVAQHLCSLTETKFDENLFKNSVTKLRFKKSENPMIKYMHIYTTMPICVTTAMYKSGFQPEDRLNAFCQLMDAVRLYNCGPERHMKSEFETIQFVHTYASLKLRCGLTDRHELINYTAMTISLIEPTFYDLLEYLLHSNCKINSFWLYWHFVDIKKISRAEIVNDAVRFYDDHHEQRDYFDGHIITVICMYYFYAGQKCKPINYENPVEMMELYRLYGIVSLSLATCAYKIILMNIVKFHLMAQQKLNSVAVVDYFWTYMTNLVIGVPEPGESLRLIVKTSKMLDPKIKSLLLDEDIDIHLYSIKKHVSDDMMKRYFVHKAYLILYNLE